MLASDLPHIFNSTNPVCKACIKPGAVTVYVFLGKPDQTSMNNLVISSKVVITGTTTDLSSLGDGDAVTVNSVAYTVKFSQKIDDGSVTEVYLK